MLQIYSYFTWKIYYYENHYTFKTLWPLFMDGVQLSLCYSATTLWEIPCRIIQSTILKFFWYFHHTKIHLWWEQLESFSFQISWKPFFWGVILNTGWKWLQGHKGVLLRLNICFKKLNNLRSRGQNIMKICSLIIFEPMIPKTIVRSCKNEEKIIYLAF